MVSSTKAILIPSPGFHLRLIPDCRFHWAAGSSTQQDVAHVVGLEKIVFAWCFGKDWQHTGRTRDLKSATVSQILPFRYICTKLKSQRKRPTPVRSDDIHRAASATARKPSVRPPEILRTFCTDAVYIAPPQTGSLSPRTAEEWQRCVCKNKAFAFIRMTTHQER